VNRFEKQAGISITGYQGRHIGEAVYLVLNGGFKVHQEQLANLAKQADRIAAEVRRALAEAGPKESAA